MKKHTLKILTAFACIALTLGTLSSCAPTEAPPQPEPILASIASETASEAEAVAYTMEGDPPGRELAEKLNAPLDESIPYENFLGDGYSLVQYLEAGGKTIKLKTVTVSDGNYQRSGWMNGRA